MGVVVKTVRTFFEYFFSFQPVELQSMYLCETICRFSNQSSNCWMNASLQAVLNLEFVQEKFVLLPADLIIKSSITPKFGEVFLTALKHPGRLFSPEELYVVLQELSEEIPSLRLERQNNILHFLEPLLNWLDECGVQTITQVKTSIRCEQCGFTSSHYQDCHIYYLSPTDYDDSILCLLISFLDDSKMANCVMCTGLVSKQQTVDFPDVLTLYLPRKPSVLSRVLVSPCLRVELPVGETLTQTYRLSSVICYIPRWNERSSCWMYDDCHTWSYLIKRGFFIVADDDLISVTDNISDMYYYGTFYFYEKCT